METENSSLCASAKSNQSFEKMEAAEADTSNSEIVKTPKLIYRCKKCRRIVASEESLVPHEQGKGQGKGGHRFRRRKSEQNHEIDNEPVQCSSIFVEPLMWMAPVQEGYVGEKLQCLGCKARLGSFSWVGMRCNCGALIIPAFQLHKNRLDECYL